MQTMDIYTTPQCGFCKALKAKLDEKNIAYTGHDVTASEKDLIDMQKLSGGGLSVPVTVLDKGTSEQQVLLGYPEAVKALGLEEKENKESAVEKNTAILTCPKCGHKQQGEIPTDSCVPFYVCQGCKQTIKAHGDECCVFCSYADKQCPLKKKDDNCSDGVCKI